jgi:hypothetical protein
VRHKPRAYTHRATHTPASLRLQSPWIWRSVICRTHSGGNIFATFPIHRFSNDVVGARHAVPAPQSKHNHTSTHVHHTQPAPFYPEALPAAGSNGRFDTSLVRKYPRPTPHIPLSKPRPPTAINRPCLTPTRKTPSTSSSAPKTAANPPHPNECPGFLRVLYPSILEGAGFTRSVAPEFALQPLF